MRGVSLKSVPMMKGRSFLYPEEIILLFKALDKKKMFKHLLNLKLLLWSGGRYMEVNNLFPENLFLEGDFLQFTVVKTKAKLGITKKNMKPRNKKMENKHLLEMKKFIRKNNIKYGEKIFSLDNKTLNRALGKIFIEMKHPYYEHLEWDSKNYRLAYKDKTIKENVVYPFKVHDFRRTHITWRLALKHEGEDWDRICLDVGHTKAVSFSSYASSNLFNIEHKFLINQLLYN